MVDNKMLNYIKDVLENMPAGWLNLTTHRLDIYDEKLAKTSSTYMIDDGKEILGIQHKFEFRDSECNASILYDAPLNCSSDEHPLDKFDQCVFKSGFINIDSIATNYFLLLQWGFKFVMLYRAVSY